MGREDQRSGRGPSTERSSASAARGRRSAARRCGDIRYRLEIDLPQKLTKEQREADEQLDEALDGGDPRAELLRKAAVAGAPSQGPTAGDKPDRSLDRRRARRLHDLRRRRARPHASPVPADVPGPRADPAEALAEEHPPGSQRDVERLRRIQRMTSEQGLNLAGVETVLDLERKVERMKLELQRMTEAGGRPRTLPRYTSETHHPQREGRPLENNIEVEGLTRKFKNGPLAVAGIDLRSTPVRTTAFSAPTARQVDHRPYADHPAAAH